MLPAIQQQQVRSGQFSEMEETSESASEAARNADLPDAPETITSSNFFSTNSVFLQRAYNASAREPVANNGSPFQPSHLMGNVSVDASHGRLFTSTNRGHKSEVGSISKTLKFGEVSTPFSFKDLNRARGNSQLKGKRSEEISPETNVDRFMENDMSSPYLRQVEANNPVTMRSSSNYVNGSAEKPESTFFGTRMQADRELKSHNYVDLDDPMDMSSRYIISSSLTFWFAKVRFSFGLVLIVHNLLRS